jgi:uncharacterized membrane protein YfcA
LDLTQAIQLWWIFPVAVAIATIALSSGISGALFFSPFFLLVVGLSPAAAIGAGLITEVFGTAFGSYNYFRQRVIDFRTVRFLLIASIPAVIAGGFLSNIIEPHILRIVFGTVLVFLAAIMLYHSTRKDTPPTAQIWNQSSVVTEIRARDGAVFKYRTCNRTIGVSLAGIGAFFTGLMSAGLPEIITTQLVLRCHVPLRVAVATSVYVLTITALFGASVHAVSAQPAWNVVVWSVPGVMVGAQLGPRLSGKVPNYIAERVLGMLFLLVGALVVILQIVG